MKLILTILTLLSLNFSFAQTKEELYKNMALDTVIQYEGRGALSIGNCLLLKFTGDAKAFFNELVETHAQSEDQIERTNSTLAIYETTKPYWIYGRYSVYAEMFPADNYTMIEIWFMGYSNPDHLMIKSAPSTYQKIVNKLLNK